MKKIVAIALALTLVAGMALTGCQKGGDNEPTTEEKVYTHDWKTDVTITPEKIDKVETALNLSENIYVNPIDGLSEDFLSGCDISSLIAEEQSGVVFYNEAGEEADLFEILAEHGVNSVRLRVWNDPYNEKGQGYGGGNCDTDKAIEMGKRATKYGLRVIIDYHYSDFWADPSKQMVPKAWAEMNADEKADACFDFTIGSLSKILNAGVDVCMVQIGNETTTGIAGEKDWSKICLIMNAGAAAVRALDPNILIAIHFTNPEKENAYTWFADKLNTYNVDYDVFASSYYSLYHGTLQNLEEVLSAVINKYHKKVWIAEISYPYTEENGDEFGNSVATGNEAYTTSVQGQANMIHDVAEVMAHLGDAGLGICYWEPAWLPVAAKGYDAQYVLWEKYGSGWASSYSKEYDPKDAGKYYGGSSWDNQALFDFTGHPLASLSTFAYLRNGNQCEVTVDTIHDPIYTYKDNEGFTQPETVTAIMTDRSEMEVPIKWYPNGNDYTVDGEYKLDGLVEYDGQKFNIHAIVRIVDPFFFDSSNAEGIENLAQNMSFEDEDTSMWTITKSDATDEAYIIKKSSDAFDGDYSFHFYSSSTPVECCCEQTITGVAPGNYIVSAIMAGGDAGSSTEHEVKLYAIADGQTYEDTSATLTGWQEWNYPVIKNVSSTDGTITIGVSVTSPAGSWGNIDYFILTPMQ